ncbi:MAG: hypothetical protein AAF288_09820 [Planctomycetota bacterium]
MPRPALRRFPSRFARRRPAPALLRRAMPARQRGSIILFAVVSAVLLALLGIAFVDLARFDRRAVAAADNRTVAETGSIVRYIGQILGRDVYPEQGDAEPYDYPWTNGSAEGAAGALMSDPYYPGEETPPTGHWGNDRRSAGYFINSGDDPHLASTEPVFDASGQIDYWPSLTYLDYEEVRDRPFLALDQIVDVDGRRLPTLYAPKVGGPPASIRPGNAPGPPGGYGDINAGMTNVQYSTLTEFNAADADGDGILDARWVFAPLPNTDGKRFIMAVRVMDLSALANINVWNRFGDESAIVTAADQPRWLWPGELDLQDVLTDSADPARTQQNLAPAVSPTVVAADPAVSAILDERFGGAVPAAVVTPWAPDNAQGRAWNWLAAASTPGDLNQANLQGFINDYGPQDYTPGTTINAPGTLDHALIGTTNEPELRWRNGLNRSSDNTNADPASDLESLDAATQFYFRQEETGTAWDNITPSIQSMNFATPRDFFWGEQRKRVTTISGLGVFEDFHLDLNGLDTTQDIDAMVEFFEGVAEYAPNRQTWRPSSTDPAEWDAAFGSTLVMCLKDFQDQDGLITRLGDAADPENVYYGMEYLPAISEVYVLQQYEGRVLDNPFPTYTFTPAIAAPPTPATFAIGTFTFEWELDAAANTSDTGITAIFELVNPWPWRITLPEDLELNIDGDALTADLRNAINTALADPDRTDQMLANERLVLVYGWGAAKPALTDPALADTPVLRELLENEALDPNLTVAFVQPDGGGAAWPRRNGAFDVDPDGVDVALLAPIEGVTDKIAYQEFTADVDADNLIQEDENSTELVDEIDAQVGGDPSNLSDIATLETYLFDTLRLTGYVQHSWKGSGNGIAALLVRRGEWSFASTLPDTEPLAGNTPDDVARNAGFVDVFNLMTLGPENLRKDGGDPDRALFADARKLVPDPVTAGDVLDDRVDDAPFDVLVANPGENKNGWVIGNAGRIHRAGDILSMVFLAPRQPGFDFDGDGDPGNDHTLADRWAEAQTNPDPSAQTTDRLTDFMIPVRADDLRTLPAAPFAAVPIDGVATVGEDVSLAAYLLGRLTTLAPSSDNRDNNGDGRLDDPAEVAVPGALNINTAPPWLIERALPYLNPAFARTYVLPAIDNGRTNPVAIPNSLSGTSSTTHSLRSHPGLAYTGELLENLAEFSAGPTFELVSTDFNEYEPGLYPNDNATGDGYTDTNVGLTGNWNREERVMLASQLNQVVSTRSDYYVAWVLVRAYPENDFTGGTGSPTQVELGDIKDEYRMIIVYDRSTVTEDDKMPRVVSVTTWRTGGTP